MPQSVVDVVNAHTVLEAEIGGYEAENAAHERFLGVYDSVARMLNATPSEIALVENATRAWDMAFYSIPFNPGDVILTSISEYASNVIAFLQIAKRGVTVEVVPNDEHGQISIETLGSMLDSRVKLVAITHMPTNGGLVQPAAAVGALARENGSFFLLDACQSAGQMPLDVDELKCDFLSATSRKFLRGPRGVGFLYVREEVIELARTADARPACGRMDLGGRLSNSSRRETLRELGKELFQSSRNGRRDRLRAGSRTRSHLDAGRTQCGAVARATYRNSSV